MSLTGEYQRQFMWRDWPIALAALPSLSGQKVLDLGCGVGDLAKQLAMRGARVLGVDLNEELITKARSRQIAQAEFILGDLRALPDLGALYDGIWSSFAVAYMPDLSPILADWRTRLKPGAWLALTEIDDLFGHDPVEDHTRALLEGYVEESLHTGRYDFRMGSRLSNAMEEAGFQVLTTMTLADEEFSFHGPAHRDVYAAWRQRLLRMKLLQDFCGADFHRVREDFLGCIGRSDHSSRSLVRFCIGRNGSPEAS